MTELKQISKSKCYEGDQFVFSHHSEVCDCDMTFKNKNSFASDGFRSSDPISWITH